MSVGKITVITVCYNEPPERVRYTLDSIVQQNYRSLEIVIIDGKSRKETVNAFDPYSDRITTFVSERDTGLYDAMNKGIGLSTGEWIIFMNVGDRFHSHNVLADVMNRGDLEAFDLLYGDTFIGGKQMKRSPDRLSRRYLYSRTICHQAMLVRRKTYGALGSFNLNFRYAADHDWILRFLNAGHAYVHVPVGICDWETGGHCSDFKTNNLEICAYRLKYFSIVERMAYGIQWTAIKTFTRIKSLNFAMPVSVRDWFLNNMFSALKR